MYACEDGLDVLPEGEIAGGSQSFLYMQSALGSQRPANHTSGINDLEQAVYLTMPVENVERVHHHVGRVLRVQSRPPWRLGVPLTASSSASVMDN